MKCDIIIPVWNQLKCTKSCIEHIVKNTRYPHRLILVDNGSEEETKNYLDNLKNTVKAEIKLIRNEKNLGFVKAINQGMRFSDAPYVCILNNDTLPGHNWLTGLVEFAAGHPEAGLVNPLCNGHGDGGLTIDEYARTLSSSNKGKYMEMNQCQGFCMLVKREVIEKAGYLDETFGIGGFDDTDYSMRAYLEGYKSVCAYSSYVYHREHKSFDKLGDRKKIQSEAEKRYFQKWPRHKRIAMVFSVSKNASDKEIENLLNSALFLAREWCWVNLLIFGDKNVKSRVEAAKSRINFPLHQNIKFNYLGSRFKILQITARILERSFGRKRRKKYDAVVCDEEKLLPFVKILCGLLGTPCFRMGNASSITCEATKDTTGPSLSLRINSSLWRNKGNIKCDIILPVCDQFEFTKKCIESIMRHTETPYRLIIINNGTNPKTRQLLDELGKREDIESTIVHNDYNIGWVKALNKGIELSSAPYLCFQNDDTIVTRGWLRKMIGILNLQEDFGMINPSWEGRPAGVSADKYNALLERQKKRFVETDWCRGFSVVIKRAVVERIGSVDEIYGLAYFDDVDYSVTAIEAGFLALKALNTYVYHHRNVTFFEVLKGRKWNELHEKNKLIYYKKWGRPLKINIILDNKKACKSPGASEKIRDAVFHLARKQHHLNIWSPGGLGDKFQHTNVRLKNCHPIFLKFLALFDLYMNRKKKPEKRYDAVFRYSEIPDFAESIKETANRIKEKTKETIDVNM